MAGKPLSSRLAERKFYEKVEFDTNGGCWLWAGAATRSGYGEVRVANRAVRAHRHAWEMHRGPIPRGHGYHGTCVCHTCDIRLCVNPSHLFLGTHADNMHDAAQKQRHAPLSGEGHPAARLSDADVREIRALSARGAYQRDIAAMFGVSQPHVGRIVRGETRNLDFIDSRAGALGVKEPA